MGEPVKFAGCNLRLGPPQGCDELKVRSMDAFSNGVCCVSCWQLSPEEIAEVTRTGRVYVAVFSGPSQPPVFVGGEQNARDLVSDYGAWKRT